MGNKYQERKERTRRRNEAIKLCFDELYHQKRIRHDDCVKEVAERFFLSEATIERILQS